MSVPLRAQPALDVAALVELRRSSRRRRERAGRALAAIGAGAVLASVLAIPVFLLFELLPSIAVPDGTGERLGVLLSGTFKASVLAVLLAIPVGLAAAVHLVCFSTPLQRSRWRPVLDLLAAIPTVVLGLIALTWLAPWLQSRIATLLVLAAAVLAAVLAGFAVFGQRLRRHPAWRPFVALALGLAAGVAVIAWDPLAGSVEADTPWNAVLVGLALGVTAVPLICTVGADALQQAWDRHVDAAVALGASRWQALRSLVLPAAAPGLAAAALLALGRCAGETMIVLMASGNTPLASADPRDGLRSLSAELALSLPVAERGGALWRMLLIATLLLFVLSFACHLAAARLRARAAS
ncbi:MAG TPA: ABC transporter permease subunit [Dokdonella sp.]|uniref:PstC family ABC transporter permease n=1 Tax=Dokdonella sp. TaxID=2291710 RepID=UPI002CD7439D|nr:ABC transporter permease subunit [Dokdonella sp.]HUD41580.1 ABC transporter permease subunit [Dokdonella sp.]